MYALLIELDETLMLLCLDVGNTHILGGVFDQENLITRFRYATNLLGTADQFGIFLLNLLNARQIPVEKITATAISSVVPSIDFTIKHTIQLYFQSCLFVLNANNACDLTIQYQNPSEVGADRLANAIGAIAQYPNQHLIIVDMGTATTLCAVTKHREYLGGAILPGMRLGMESLKANTAKLMLVDIETPIEIIGSSTRESIQVGLYYGQLGALKEMINNFKTHIFHHEKIMVIGTGGFSQMYKDKQLFDVILPDLVLQGLYQAYQSSLQ